MALELDVPVIQVVGYQNSGKTTYVEKLIKQATLLGLRVATVKHHGHGGEPDMIETGKDSDRHRIAGALATSVEGDGVLQLYCKRGEWQLNDILTIYQQLPIDLVIVEGYKKENYPKVVLVRNEDDLPLLDQLTNIMAVISWFPLEEDVKQKYVTFNLENDESVLLILQVVREIHE
ncbi:molybdopterin-guanine dinucleotide biosynthesis protein B [Cytobacillus suaedae]|nr:molybdopterin-guanine dinucleotide biosynthesis protein B [Cytobacillus suaedae]